MARPWLKVEGAVLEHPKTERLAQLWQCHPYMVVGFLIKLWDYCLEYQPTGNVDRCPSDVLERFAQPCLERAIGTVPTVREALEDVGFIDRTGRIHDWYEYAGAIVQQRRNDRLRKRLERADGTRSRALPVRKRSTGHVLDKRRKSGPRVEQSRVEKKATSDGQAALFQRCWTAYPKRAGTNSKAAALRHWQARIAEGASPDELLAGAERYARFCRAAGKWGSEYVMQAQRFFGRDRHWTEAWAIAGERAAAPPPAPKTTKFVADTLPGAVRAHLVEVPLDDPRPAVA